VNRRTADDPALPGLRARTHPTADVERSGRPIRTRGSRYQGITFQPTSSPIALFSNQQTRAAFDPITTVRRGPASTISRGFKAQAQWNVTKNLFHPREWRLEPSQVSAGRGLSQVDARSVGFPDVVDAKRKVIIPAEAVWLGRFVSRPSFRQ